MKPGFTHFRSFVPKTFHFKLLSIAATVILAVAAVVVSVHSSSAPAAKAEGAVAKAGDNSRVPVGKSKTSHAAAVRSLMAPLAPTVTATKTDSLFTDVDGDLQADPGDTLQYTVNINSIGEDATGVTFTDTVDPNTAFVPGSLKATPVAVDDSYIATGNIRISVAAPGVLGNDFTGVPAATITAPPSTSANGGDVTLNADGSFTYNPPAGFEGVDTFSYTLTNTAGSNSATVSITVSGMIWFIDNNAAACTTLAAGCGRLTNPFSSLSAFAALNNGAGNNPAANDNIFVYESVTDYVGPVALLNGQRFLGQDATASLSAMTGLTPPAGSDPLPATNSGNGTIVNITTGNAITVASGNTLRGFTGGNSTTDITGTGFGTLTISDVTLNGTGQALNLTTGTLAATFGSISSTNSATTGVSLTGVAGSLTSPTTAVTNPAGIGISVGTSSATHSFGNTSATSSGDTGVSLLANTGTITFGTLTITPDANQRGLLATDNTNTITSTGGAITTSGAIAVEITRAIGTTPLAISQTSVSASGGLNGIKLTNVSGSFTVTGDSGGSNNGSGGTISGATAEGVVISTASNVSLGYLNITNSGTDGINTTGVNGFTLNRGNVTDSAGIATDEGLQLLNTSGTLTITNSVISSAPHHQIFVDNNNTNMASFVMTNSTAQCVAGNPCQPSGSIGEAGLLLQMRGTSVLTRGSVTGSIFSGLRTTGLGVFTANTGRIGASSGGAIVAPAASNSFTVETSSFTDNNIGIDFSQSQVSNLAFQILNNTTITGHDSHAINVGTAAGAGTGPASHAMVGKIDGNVIGTQGTNDSGSRTGSGLRVVIQGDNTQGSFLVNNNTFREVVNADVMTFTSQNGAGVSGTGTARFQITNNTLPQPSGSNESFCGPPNTPCASNGIFVLADEGNLACNVITGNDIYDVSTMNGIADVYLAERTGPPAGALLTVEGTGGDNGTYIQANNTLAGALPFIDESGTTTQVAPGSCGTFPSAPQPLDENLLTKPSNDPAAQTTEGGATQTTDILLAGGLEKLGEERVASLSGGALTWMVQAALARWEESGISAADLMRLRQTTFEVADLPGQQLATATSTSVQIDETAAGYGWYSDLSPMEDSEFGVPVPGRELQTTESSAAFGRIDLLTVLMRELGTVYLQGKKLTKQLRPLMEGTLSPAVRRLPDSRNIQLPSSTGVSGKNRSGSEESPVSQIGKRSAPQTGVSTSLVPSRNARLKPIAQTAPNRSSKLMHHAPRSRTTAASMLADVMLSIGTLPAGESVTITFNVTVNNPFTGAMSQVSNQGTVSGSNFSDVLTDDPTVGGTADPTVTPIDLPDVSVAVSPAAVAEDGATNLVYTFTRNGSTANALTVNFSIGGSANFGASPNDYTQTGAATFTPPTGTVTFGAGNSTATVTVNPEADTTVETDETVVLTVTSGIGYDVGSPSSASGTITNDDTDVSVAVSPASVAEDGATNLVYTFTRVGDTSGALTVNFSIAVGGSNAVFPADYTQTGAATFAPPVGTVTFGAGNSTATVTVDPAADAIVEPDETVIFAVTAGAGYNVGSPASATGTITNDDADVSVTVAPSSATEDGATNLVYTFTRTGFTVLPATVNFSVGGSAVFSSGDYTQTGAATYTDTSGTVLFGAGASTATVTIDPSADITVEPDETVVLTVTAGVGYNVGSPDSATGTIINDDTDVSVAVAPGSVAEDGATNLVYTFTRAGVTSSSLTVNFSVGGSAVFGPSPDDYTQTGATTFTTTSGSVTFGAGNSTATVTVNPEADSTVESNETVDLTLTAGAGYNVGSPSSASGTITNDDTDVNVVVAPVSVAEDGAANLVYTFTRVGVTSSSLTVNFSVGGTAAFGASPNDYTQTGATTYTTTSGTVTFGAGNSIATVTVDPETDTTIETDETVILTLTSGAGYNVSLPSSATGTITNDDADVSVAVAPASVAEDGATNLVYTFTRTGFTGGALTVNFSVGGTATFGVSPDDYTQTGATTYTTTTGSVTFAPASSTATVTVNPETDATAEADETVIITLTGGASYNVVNPSSATGTILNDDTLVSVVVSPSSTAEGGANLVYTFTRTGPTTSAVTANFSVGGSASFPGDYTQSGATTFTPPTATVTFGVGSSTKTVTVTPLTDCTVEGSETVVFTVQPGTGYGVGSPSSATGTITNTPDSSAPTITLIPNVNMTLWPPNHQYESIAVTDFVASASDNCDPSVNVNSVYITQITSDEVENGNGDGNTLNDIVIGASCKTAQLRSERDGSGNGRVYTIFFKVKDSAGNFATASTTVTVRKNPNSPAVDSGTHYTVNSICP